MSTATLQSSESELPASDGNHTRQLLSFRLGEEEYGIEIDNVREVILMRTVTEVPETPPYIAGLISLRSTVIPVVDLSLRLGLPEISPTTDTRIIVVEIGGKTMGLIVDAVHEVLRVSPQQISPPPTDATTGLKCLAGVARLNGRLILLLDIEFFDVRQR